MLITRLIVLLLCFIFSNPSMGNEIVNVYTYRKPQLIKPLFNVFTRNTGIEVNSVFAKKGMLEKIVSEGRNSPADLILTVDIGRLTDLKNAGVTQPIDSVAIKKNIPSNFRDPDGHWFGLTSRARIIVSSKTRVKIGAIKSYEDLISNEWKGRICTRSGKHPYMTALIASVMAASGEEEARTWLSGLKNNLARKPQGNDRAQVRAIYEGQCDVAVINHYYMAMMLADPQQKNWASAINIIFPNQDDRGTHMNVSGAAIAKFAPNKKNAEKLLEFLASLEGQQIYGSKNGEYPVSRGVPRSDLLISWGDFKQDSLSLVDVASYRKKAIMLADRVGYND